MRQIITSMLDTDFYKLTMGQFIWKLYPQLMVRYALIDRGTTHFPPGFAEELQRQVDLMGNLKLSGEEYTYLLGLNMFSDDYVSWFQKHRFNPDQVQITQEGGDLTVIIEGPWVETVYWEVPLMALISELYFVMTGKTPQRGYYNTASQMARDLQNAGIRWSDFGSRRRASCEVQGNVLVAASHYKALGPMNPGLIGTSNVHWARLLNLRPIGTMAHELFMALVAFYGDKVIGSRQVLAGWKLLYGDQLSVLLPDTYTTDLFLSQIMTAEEAQLWAAIRQDSGIPEAFVDKVLAYYSRCSIDPMTKSIVFSDSLTTARAIELAKYCVGKIKCLFGIGTNFTNNVGFDPLKIVIKIIAVFVDGEWVLASKESDDPAKSTGVAKPVTTMA